MVAQNQVEEYSFLVEEYYQTRFEVNNVTVTYIKSISLMYKFTNVKPKSLVKTIPIWRPFDFSKGGGFRV